MRKARRLGAFICIMAVVCLALAGRPVAAASPRVDLDLVGAGIADVFRALAELGDMNIVLDPAVSGTLTIRLHDLTVEEALKLVAYTTGVEYRVVGSSLIVTPPGKPSAFDPVRVERFSLTHARVDDVMPALELVADNTKLQADARTNSVIARGPVAGLEQVKQVISMLDVAVAPPEADIPAKVEDAKAEPPAPELPAPIPAPVESLDIVKLRYASARSVAGLLSLVVPSGKIQADSEINAIVMLADEVALGRAHEIIAQVDVAPAAVPLGSAPAKAEATEPKAPAEADAVKVIKLAWSPAEKVAEALRVVVEGVRIGTDSRTNSLVVRAGQSEMLRVEEIASLLDVSVAEPETPKSPEAPKPEPRSLTSYSLVHADPNEVQRALTLVVSAGAVHSDARTRSLLVFGTPEETARAREMIALLDAPTPAPAASPAPLVDAPRKAPEPDTLKATVLEYADVQVVRDALRAVLPSENIIVDSRTSKVIVRGTAAQHVLASEIIAMLDVPEVAKAGATKPAEPAPVRAIHAFRLAQADPIAVRDALALVMPRDAVHVDTHTRTALVLGLPNEIAKAGEIVALLDTAVAPAPGGPTAAAGATEAQDEAESEPEDEPEQKQELPANVMRVVRLEHAKASETREVVASAVPGVGLTADSRTNSLIVVGPDELQARVDQLVAALDVRVDPPETAQQPSVAAPEPVAEPAAQAPAPVKTVHAFRLKQADPAAVREALALVLPRDAVHVDMRTRTAIVLGLPDDIAMASEIVELLDTAAEYAEAAQAEARAAAPVQQPKPEPEPPADVMRVIRLKHAEAAQVREAIASAVPGVRLTADGRTNSLIVVAPGEMQAKVDDLVAALDIGIEPPAVAAAPAEAAPKPEPETAEVVRLEYAAPAAVRQALAPTLPESKMSVDERTASIVIVGTAAQREQARRIIAQLDVEVPPSADEIAAPTAPADPEVLQVFQLAHAPASRVREALAPVVPVANMTVDERTNSLIINASRLRMARAAEVIERLDVEIKPVPSEAAAPIPQPEAEVARYRLANAPAESLRSAVSLLAPSSDVQVDSRTNTLLVRAVPSVQQRVAELVRGLDIPVASAPEPEPRPEPTPPAPPPEVMKVFRLTHAAASDMKTLLGIVAPAAKMQPDDRTKSLIVMAPASTLAALDELVRALDIPAAPTVQANAQPAPEPDPVVTRVYRLNHAVAGDVAKALEGLVKGTVKADERTSSLVIEAAESQHARALGLIEELDRELAQVLIEARLEELSGDAGRRLGLDWSFNGLTFTPNAYGQWVSVSLDFLTNLTALEEQGKASLISRQHTFTVSGKTGKILIGDRIPVMIQEVQDGVAVTKLDFINAGIELSITPTVSEDGTITATVKPVISSIVGWTPQNYPQIRTRELETIVSLKSGNTAVIGGMLHRDEIESLAKVPILGEIPLLGELFKKRSTTTEHTEIVVMITAWQVNPGQRPVVGPATSGEKFPVKVEDSPTKTNPAN